MWNWLTAAAAPLGALAGYIAPRLSDRYISTREALRGVSLKPTPRSKLEQAVYIIAGAAVFTLAAWRLPPVSAVAAMASALVLLTAADIDNRVRLLPNPYIITLLVVGVLSRLLAHGISALPGMGIALVISILLLALSAVLTSLIMHTTGIVGAGDVKLIMVMALASGYPGFLYGLAAMAAALVGYAVFGMMFRRLTPKSYIPMGGPIVAGYLVSLFF